MLIHAICQSKAKAHSKKDGIRTVHSSMPDPKANEQRHNAMNEP
jgi:hypothetical protein